jgi:hypothetical protein
LLQTGYLSVLATRLRPFHIADDGLPTLVHMDMLDPDKLLPAVTQSPKNLDLCCISPHQTGRRRPECRYSLLRPKGTVHLSEDGYGGCVRACHLDGEGSFNFVPRRGGFDYSESGINVGFRNCAERRTSRSLNLKQRGVHEIARRRSEGFFQSLGAVAGKPEAELSSALDRYCLWFAFSTGCSAARYLSI